MPTPGSTIADRITDLIGAEYATIPSLSYKDLINAAFNEAADLISDDLLLKYSSAPTTVTSASGVSIEDKKILKVTRIDANAYSPIYKLHSDNAASTLVIYPDCDGSGQEGKIFYFTYATNSTDLSAITAATLNTSHFLPTTSIHAIVLKSCVNILNSYISNQIQDEEDVELMQMLQNQIQLLEKSFLEEIQRFQK